MDTSRAEPRLGEPQWGGGGRATGEQEEELSWATRGSGEEEREPGWDSVRSLGGT